MEGKNRFLKNCVNFFSDYSLLYKQMFPRDRLVFGTDLGTGWFGKVGRFWTINLVKPYFLNIFSYKNIRIKLTSAKSQWTSNKKTRDKFQTSRNMWCIIINWIAFVMCDHLISIVWVVFWCRIIFNHFLSLNSLPCLKQLSNHLCRNKKSYVTHATKKLCNLWYTVICERLAIVVKNCCFLFRCMKQTLIA